MADAYTPVFKSITTSTIWLEKAHVVKVWLLMLLICDKNGVVEGSVPGIANAAVVSLDECTEAIRVFLSPDPHSRTKDFEGRRIEEVDGGWRILNHRKHREKLGLAPQSSAQRVARHRAKKAKSVTVTHETHVTDVTPETRYCNEQKQEQEQKEDQITTAAATEKIPCPKDLRLTDDQRGSLETALIPGWAIDEITARYVAAELADSAKTMPLVAWRKCLSKAISGGWNDPKRRPQKPTPQAATPAEKPRPRGEPGQEWHQDSDGTGYWFWPLPKRQQVAE